jgi:hypothetical protein
MLKFGPALDGGKLNGEVDASGGLFGLSPYGGVTGGRERKLTISGSFIWGFRDGLK